jgi:osmotically-inducible protein OsmY
MEEAMSDRELRRDILDELEFEPSIDAAHIGVAVDAGVVTLSGHVSSYAQKLAAEAAVRRVKGVRAIAEEIEVRYPNGKRTADDEIAKRAADILSWNADVPQDSIRITVRDGWVTLNGQVRWQFQKHSAEEQIRKLSGVSGIIDNVTIEPRIQPADIKQKIEDAFRRHAEIEAQRIRVCVLDGGKVVLEGTVHDWNERCAAERAAWSAPGVMAVEDRLTIA